MSSSNNKKDLIQKIRNEEGTLEQSEQWLAELKELDPYFYSSDMMLHLEDAVLARREYEHLVSTMGEKLEKSQLVALVTKICNAEGTDIQILAWMRLLKHFIPYPGVSDLIFYTTPELTPEEIVEQALSYKPIAL